MHWRGARSAKPGVEFARDALSAASTILADQLCHPPRPPAADNKLSSGGAPASYVSQKRIMPRRLLQRYHLYFLATFASVTFAKWSVA